MIALDIETVPNEEALKTREWAEYKEKKQCDDQMAALHPAFCQVVCVCAFNDETKRGLKICDPSESLVLQATWTFLNEERAKTLGGHNIKKFDIPILCNRFLNHNLFIPECMRVAGKKPWEIAHVDSMELMKHGSGDHISLDATCLILGITSPKTGNVSALGVWDAFKEGRFDDIKQYCRGDVTAFLNVISKLSELGVL